MWWMLRSIGHSRVRVLDGGFGAWLEEGHPVESGPVSPAATSYPDPPGFKGVVDIDNIEGRTLIVVTHRESMLTLVDQLVVMDGGRVVAAGPKSEVLLALSQGRVRKAV